MSSSEPHPEDGRTEVTLLARHLTVELEAFSHGFAIQHDLHPTDVRAIVIIMDTARTGGSLRPSDLSKRLALSTASVTSLLDRLERNGHIKRVRHPTDRRGVIVVPDDSMMQLGGAFFGGLQRRMVAVLATFSDEEVSAAKRVMEALIAVIN